MKRIVLILPSKFLADILLCSGRSRHLNILTRLKQNTDMDWKLSFPCSSTRMGSLNEDRPRMYPHTTCQWVGARYGLQRKKRNTGRYTRCKEMQLEYTTVFAHKYCHSAVTIFSVAFISRVPYQCFGHRCSRLNDTFKRNRVPV